MVTLLGMQKKGNFVAIIVCLVCHLNERVTFNFETHSKVDFCVFVILLLNKELWKEMKTNICQSNFNYFGKTVYDLWEIYSFKGCIFIKLFRFMVSISHGSGNRQRDTQRVRTKTLM